MAKNKTLMYVGIASAVLITGGLIWWFASKNKNKGTENKDQENPPPSDTGTPPASDTGTPPATTPATPPAPQQESLPPTPFKNKEEGNIFRVWVNRNYPNFSYQGEKLDTTGAYDNKYIRKAWQLYGAEYQKSSQNVPEKTQRFLDVQKNLGVSTTASVLSVNFNSGVNEADFYDNGRFVIRKKGTQGYLKKGSYYNGGKKLVIDNGATIEGNSVWTNLRKTL